MLRQFRSRFQTFQTAQHKRVANAIISRTSAPVRLETMPAAAADPDTLDTFAVSISLKVCTPVKTVPTSPVFLCASGEVRPWCLGGLRAGPTSSDEDHLKMTFSSFARRTEALANCFLRIGSARTR